MTGSEQVVLVVEDNKSNMRLCHDLLQAHGYKVVRAKDGSNGWHMAREHRPNLILLDIQLPDLSGLEVVSQLRADEDLRSIPVIAMTAFAMNGDREKFLQNGFDAYISKPISVVDFLQTVEQLICRE